MNQSLSPFRQPGEIGFALGSLGFAMGSDWVRNGFEMASEWLCSGFNAPKLALDTNMAAFHGWDNKQVNFISSDSLEWEGVRALVRRFISTSAGDAELEKTAPSIDRPAIERSLAEAGEGMAYLRASSGPQPSGKSAIRVNLNGLPNVTVSVQKLHIEGAALEPREIFDLIGFRDRAADAKSSLTAAAERFPLLAARAHAIGDFRDLLRTVEGKIQADGTVLDSASPHLNRIRREIEKQK